MKLTKLMLFTLALMGAFRAQAQIFDVEIKNLAYNPKNITIPQGATVRWTNNEVLTSHTVTADDFSFDSGILTRGQQFSHTFTQPGVYPYHCEIHLATMTGTVTVTSSGTEISPLSFSIFRGKLIAGGLASMSTSDDSKMEVAMGPVVGAEKPISVDVGGSSSTLSGSQLTVKVEMSVTRTGLNQSIYLMNYQTNQLDLVDSRPGTTSDSTVQINIMGGANVAKYIKSDGSVSIRIGVGFGTGSSQPKNFHAKIDYVHWTISP